MDITTEIWNRAAGFEDMDGFRDGDRALHDALLLHGTAMNGGLLHALESLEADELTAAVAGFRWLGLAGTAEQIEAFAADAVDADAAETEALEERGNELYYGAVPDDDVLEAAFRARHAELPEAFAPLA
ncbi:hypothetical protein [Georgenia sp. AZ-5]|uniref:hypothetical protein n=1 Tax=Georgenia sp. AZ-5 TaxID=3367526 RepID=UPI0037546619